MTRRNRWKSRRWHSIKYVSFDACKEYIADASINTSKDNGDCLKSAKNVLSHIIAEQLSERQKQVALLYFFERKNIPQIAQLLEVNKSTVSRTLARALKNINDRMKYYRLR